MKCALFSVFMVLFLSGCTIYRSEGRKQFESEAPGKVSATANFELKSCKKENRFETWFHEEFPSSHYEMVVMGNDLEVWRTHRGVKVEVKAIQKSDSAVHSCIYEFANDIVWNLYKESFIRELEDNVMTLE
ncbi:MAG: hypothetical protein OM95_12085 [Bdellovibrio sp. ArHS]|uniref:hypothetical protein n=1 Tax=Bdellovibrio sp. ArHS TaxID=1569284 RepID=UPI0005826E64|nr:hypothetical protein [Bdellovibrio sp. ArHS]KHD87751.1 MAG: hypothetical protein OM95_12085 [Bdellovibrio sp. ArHS]